MLRIIFELILICATGISLYVLYQSRKNESKERYIIQEMRHISRKMYELGNEEEFIKEVCDTVQSITHSNEFAYFKYVPEEDILLASYVVGPYKNQLLQAKMKMGEGFTGYVAKERKAMFLNNANKSTLAKHVPGTPDEDSALLAVPIAFAGDLLGVILQTKLGGSTFNKDDLRLSEIFVNLAAGFIAGENYVSMVRQGFVDMLRVLINTVELKDTYTAGHSVRVSRLSEIIAKKMNLSEKEVTKIKIGGLLHDIGKIGIQESILRKSEKLEDEELTEIKNHPGLGAKLIIKFKMFTGVADAILYHHETYDGTGYPDGLQGEAIPISSRIIAVADAIDAMTFGRPGRGIKSVDEAFAELKKFSGTQFDPKLVDICNNNKDVIKKVLEEAVQIDEFATEEELEKISL